MIASAYFGLAVFAMVDVASLVLAMALCGHLIPNLSYIYHLSVIFVSFVVHVSGNCRW